jgi:hypothetical protein
MYRLCVWTPVAAQINRADNAFLMQDSLSYRGALAILLGVAFSGELRAAEDLEFVAEHLPEVAMDNRYATLPIWIDSTRAVPRTSFQVQVAFSDTSIGGLDLTGPLLSLGVARKLNESWRLGAFAFYDRLHLTSGVDARPLQTSFAPATPIARPVAAQFSGLDGHVSDFGAGISIGRIITTPRLGAHLWTAGLLWQQVELRDYRFDYLITAGPQAGFRGQIDFDSNYRHVAPFVGAQITSHYGKFSLSPHVLFVLPLPRRGIVGHITGPGFDLRGNTAEVGAGKHFGDPSLSLGMSLTYEPTRLSFDIGTVLTQALLEPAFHRGVKQNYVISISMRR